MAAEQEEAMKQQQALMKEQAKAMPKPTNGKPGAGPPKGPPVMPGKAPAPVKKEQRFGKPIMNEEDDWEDEDL